MENIVVELNKIDRKVHFEIVSADHPSLMIPFDYAPPLGTGDGLTGLEALVMTFCGCVSTAIVGLMMRLGKRIDSYSVRAEGVRTEQPLTLSKILFHVMIESDDITPEDMDKVLKQAELISPVWLAIQNNVAVETSYRLN